MFLRFKSMWWNPHNLAILTIPNNSWAGSICIRMDGCHCYHPVMAHFNLARMWSSTFWEMFLVLSSATCDNQHFIFCLPESDCSNSFKWVELDGLCLITMSLFELARYPHLCVSRYKTFSSSIIIMITLIFCLIACQPKVNYNSVCPWANFRQVNDL